jgi:hypothetical protein
MEQGISDMTNILQDKSIIVTGTSGGIGRATSIAHAVAGARIVVSDIVEEDGQGTAKTILYSVLGEIKTLGSGTVETPNSRRFKCHPARPRWLPDHEIRSASHKEALDRDQ